MPLDAATAAEMQGAAIGFMAEERIRTRDGFEAGVPSFQEPAATYMASQNKLQQQLPVWGQTSQPSNKDPVHYQLNPLQQLPATNQQKSVQFFATPAIYSAVPTPPVTCQVPTNTQSQQYHQQVPQRLQPNSSNFNQQQHP